MCYPTSDGVPAPYNESVVLTTWPPDVLPYMSCLTSCQSTANRW